MFKMSNQEITPQQLDSDNFQTWSFFCLTVPQNILEECKAKARSLCFNVEHDKNTMRRKCLFKQRLALGLLEAFVWISAVLFYLYL